MCIYNIYIYSSCLNYTTIYYSTSIYIYLYMYSLSTYFYFRISIV